MLPSTIFPPNYFLTSRPSPCCSQNQLLEIGWNKSEATRVDVEKTLNCCGFSYVNPNGTCAAVGVFFFVSTRSWVPPTSYIFSWFLFLLIFPELLSQSAVVLHLVLTHHRAVCWRRAAVRRQHRPLLQFHRGECVLLEVPAFNTDFVRTTGLCLLNLSTFLTFRSSESGSPIDTGISKIPDQTPELFYNHTKNELYCLKHVSVYFFVIYTFMGIVRLMQHREYKSRNYYILYKSVPNICQSLRKNRLSRNEKRFQFQLFWPSCRRQLENQSVVAIVLFSCLHYVWVIIFMKVL